MQRAPRILVDLGGECRVIGSLEGAYAMGLQAMRVPDPLHGAEADADGFGDHAAGPMRGRLGRLAAWQREHLGDGGGCKWGPTRFARLVSHKAVDAFLGRRSASMARRRARANCRTSGQQDRRTAALELGAMAEPG